MTKPGIIYGNDLSALAGFLLAAQLKHHFDWQKLVAFLAGVSLVIACGCVLNNLMDRRLDAKMARTKQRALVTGQIKPYQARIYGVTLGFIGFWLLLVFVNQLTAALGAIALFFYLVPYGLSKRRSHFGVLVGSISGAMPIAAGYTAVTNHFDKGALILFLTMVFWQMPHFYAIALYRYQDYKKAGVPVLTVKKGSLRTKYEILAYILAFTVAAASLTVAGYNNYAYMAVMIILGFNWLWEGFSGLKRQDDEAWGRHMFRFSLIVLLIFCAMVALGPRLP
ncbi:MAG TPA: heme o synthase [Candidatus Saccharimonadales bacterium]|nr:heme o synthase [Candidatus Saccharimonadales bacterium]